MFAILPNTRPTHHLHWGYSLATAMGVLHSVRSHDPVCDRETLQAGCTSCTASQRRHLRAQCCAAGQVCRANQMYRQTSARDRLGTLDLAPRRLSLELPAELSTLRETCITSKRGL
jgi:hypothetical protein